MATITETAIARDIQILPDTPDTVDVEEIASWTNTRWLHQYLYMYPTGESDWVSRANPGVAVGNAQTNRVAIIGHTGERWAYRSRPPYTPATPQTIRPEELGWPGYSVQLDAQVTFDVSDDADAELLVAARIIGAPAGTATTSEIAITIDGPGGEVYSLETSLTTDINDFWTVGAPSSWYPVALVAGEHTLTGHALKLQARDNYYLFFQVALRLV